MPNKTLYFGGFQQKVFNLGVARQFFRVAQINMYLMLTCDYT